MQRLTADQFARLERWPQRRDGLPRGGSARTVARGKQVRHTHDDHGLIV